MILRALGSGKGNGQQRIFQRYHGIEEFCRASQILRGLIQIFHGDVSQKEQNLLLQELSESREIQSEVLCCFEVSF